MDPLGEDVIELLFVAEDEGDVVEEIEADPVDEKLDVLLGLVEALELIVVVIVEDDVGDCVEVTETEALPETLDVLLGVFDSVDEDVWVDDTVPEFEAVQLALGLVDIEGVEEILVVTVGDTEGVDVLVILTEPVLVTDTVFVPDVVIVDEGVVVPVEETVVV